MAASVAILVVGGVFLSGRPDAATAGGQAGFRGSASAEGVRTGVVAAGAPLTNQVVDGASPISQAAVDSTSGSTALASTAYPGDLIITAPGLVAGFSGGKTSGTLPEYPLIAAAGSTGRPEAKADAPGSSMRASGVARSLLNRRGRAVKPPRVRERAPEMVGSVGEMDVVAQAEPESVTSFMPLVAGGAPLASGQLVRVSVPRSALAALGLPQNPTGAGDTIKADVLLGDDGLARAIRFVR